MAKSAVCKTASRWFDSSRRLQPSALRTASQCWATQRPATPRSASRLTSPCRIAPHDSAPLCSTARLCAPHRNDHKKFSGVPQRIAVHCIAPLGSASPRYASPRIASHRSGGASLDPRSTPQRGASRCFAPRAVATLRDTSPRCATSRAASHRIVQKVSGASPRFAPPRATMQHDTSRRPASPRVPMHRNATQRPAPPYDATPRFTAHCTSMRHNATPRIAPHCYSAPRIAMPRNATSTRR